LDKGERREEREPPDRGQWGEDKPVAVPVTALGGEVKGEGGCNHTADRNNRRFLSGLPNEKTSGGGMLVW
jgi:alpha-L-arabinofuranosidase